jgi:uroporphyrin-III C-methyltransferase
MIQRKDSKVTLVGAGPGNPDLISLAGVKALKSADVVLYDALVNTDLLLWAKRAKKIFVGKRKGYKKYSQEEINRMLVSNAFEHGNVVRLKGGDPFIFGRGAEEVNYVSSFGIDTTVIPGISSSTSAATTQGISLTQRGISHGFWVITGTTKEGLLADDVRLAVQSNSTVVILMGMSKLRQIVNLFSAFGKGKTPIAIVMNAYLPSQKKGIGTIDSILKIAKREKLSNPSVIIIGEVVRYGQKVMSEFLLNPTVSSQIN